MLYDLIDVLYSLQFEKSIYSPHYTSKPRPRIKSASGFYYHYCIKLCRFDS